MRYPPAGFLKVATLSNWSITMNKMTIADARSHIMQAHGVLNLNAGTCSPVPQPVFDVLVRQLQQQSSDPAEFIWSASIPLIENGRQALAAFLQCDADNLLLFTNASFAVNTVMQTFSWNRNDEIITTDQEYHHYLPLFEKLVQEKGIRITRVTLPLGAASGNLSAADICKLFADRTTPATRAVFFSHITSPTGFRLPAKEICAWARTKNILSIVDGAHAPGHTTVSLQNMAPDFYTANVHKWMMNPAGCAFLYAAPALRFAFKPLICMAGYPAIGKRENRTTRIGTSSWGFAHEYQGTRNLTPLTVLAESVGFFNRIGLEAIQNAWQENRQHLEKGLRRIGLDIVSPASSELQSCMIACRIPVAGGKIDTLVARNFFRQNHGIELAFPSLNDEMSLLRVSAAWFNTKEEFDRLILLLTDFAWSRFC